MRPRAEEGVWGHSVAVSFCCSLFLTVFLCAVVCPPEAAVPLGEHLLCHGAPPPPPTTVLLPLFLIPVLFPPPLFLQHFLPFLKYVSTEAPPPWLLGSAMPCSVSTGAGWNKLCLVQGRPGLSSQRHPPCSPLLQAPGHLYPVQGLPGCCFKIIQKRQNTNLYKWLQIPSDYKITWHIKHRVDKCTMMNIRKSTLDAGLTMKNSTLKGIFLPARNDSGQLNAQSKKPRKC